MVDSTGDPLLGPPPPEVPLVNAPLVRVIAQVRFPLLMNIEQREHIVPFQAALGDKYPVLRQEQAQGVVLSTQGLAPAPPKTIWRFSDVGAHFRVSLTSDFVALETTAYASRRDFLARLREVLTCLQDQFDPKLADRVGLRYVDRVVGGAVADIKTLVRPEVRGICGTPLADHVVHALSESVFEVEGARLVARWGQIPAGETTDQAAIEPTDEPSWVLDLDMFNSTSTPFSVDGVMADAEHFAQRLYALFRWAVTDEFLRRYGGKP